MSYLEAFRMDLAEYELKTLSYTVFFLNHLFLKYFSHRKIPVQQAGRD